MKEHSNLIAVIYGILLALVTIMCVGAFLFVPVQTYSSTHNAEIVEIEPSETEQVNADERVFYLRGVDWSSGGNYLYFSSSHQEVEVKADGALLFRRNAVQTFWGSTPGFAREFIEIPAGTREVTVSLTACYDEVRDTTPQFYHGYPLQMFQQTIRDDGLTLISSFINICLGAFMLILGIAMRKRTNVGSAMIYLALFSIMIGIWAVFDNGIVAFLVKNRAACSYVSFASLSAVSIPLVMFIRRYLQPDDRYVHKIILGINIVNPSAMFLLEFLGIRDPRQTVILTHIAMLSACLYIPFALVHMLRKHLLTRQFWVTLMSLLTMVPPLAYSLYLYYNSSKTVNGYGTVLILIFISIFAVDVCRTIMRDIDAGKKAAIYQELAMTDLLTGCYNRNAYRNDTENWEHLKDVLLVTCDLNNLKQCNDTLGHAYGDLYITDSASMLKKIFSNHGNVYRIGGDEFVIIIPNRHKCNISVLLAELTEEQRIYNLNSPVLKIQIARGYSEFDETTDKNIEDIRIRADERMYEHKKELKSACFIEYTKQTASGF